MDTLQQNIAFHPSAPPIDTAPIDTYPPPPPIDTYPPPPYVKHDPYLYDNSDYYNIPREFVPVNKEIHQKLFLKNFV
jgi:hypothetical protein